MLFAVLLLLPFVLGAAEFNHLDRLVEDMRKLTLKGDHRGVGRLVPVVLEELREPYPNASIGWNQVGGYFTVQGDYRQAERAYLQGMRLAEHREDSAAMQALLRLNLASLYLETGRPSLAEVLCRRALQSATELYGPKSSELTTFLYTLAAARQQQGDHVDARKYFQQALDSTGTNAEGRLRKGSILASLAVVYAADKKWMQARDLLSESIALSEPLLGPSHPDLIRTHLNMARVYERLKQWDSASASVATARQIAETRLGSDHAVMAEILTTSASVLRNTGRKQEAKDLSRMAKAIASVQPKDPTSSAWVHVADLARQSR